MQPITNILVLDGDIRINKDWYDDAQDLYDALDNMLAERVEDSLATQGTCGIWRAVGYWTHDRIDLWYNGAPTFQLTDVFLDVLLDKLEEGLDAENDRLHDGHSPPEF